MTVKTIFKTLIGTVFFIVAVSALTEFFNVNISGMQIRQMTKMAANQACALFTQETYKTDGAQGARGVNDVVDKNGTIYVTGDFYGGLTNAADIWYSIYSNSEFLDFCNGTGIYETSDVPSGYANMKDAFQDLEVLNLAVASNGNPYIPPVPSWDMEIDDPAVIEYNKAQRAKTYWNTMFTAVNVGIPYMDSEIVNRMFQWNLAQILSNCDPDSIQTDENGDMFINYKGFRCYAQAAEMTGYKYTTLNLKDTADAIEFNRLTGMSVNALNADVRGLGNSDDSDGREENNFVTIVGIEYRIPISYVGITPIKRIFNYAWNREVGGFRGTQGGYTMKSWSDEKLSSVASGTHDGIEYLEAGGKNGANSSGKLPANGKLVYTLIR